MDTWQLQEAKAKFSEVVRRAQKAPQTVTKHGEREAIILSPEAYDRLAGQKKRRKKKPDFLTFMRQSPLYGVELDLERDKSPVRDIDFSDLDV